MRVSGFMAKTNANSRYAACILLPLLALCLLPTYAAKHSHELENRIHIQDDGAGLILLSGNDPILRYNYAPFESVDQSEIESRPAYRIRTGYIHPVWSPKGSELTEIYPESHTHHLGLWHAWTKTHYLGEGFDFWNLKEAQEEEMVQFANFIWKEEKATSAAFKAQHFYLLKDEPVLNETLEVRAYKHDERYFIDYTVEQEWLKEEPLILQQWRYGGALAWRYPSRWINSSATVETSEGLIQPMGYATGADATQARWLKVHGYDLRQASGFLIMSHPENFRHPESLRVLHVNAQSGGYVHFTPIREASWQLEKGQPHTYRYRICTFDETLSAAQAEEYWQQYAESAHPSERP